MNRSLRWLAAILLALVVPTQAMAAACAQICMRSLAQATVPLADVAHSGDHADCHGKGEKGAPDPGGGQKSGCCHAHTFMMEPSVVATPVTPPSFEPLRYVSRWTSFIPEEPSPPPIASAR